MDLISVIVPVYNVEMYLDKCVQSIVDQTYTNLEIILVDDGSPDHCPAMCDAWAQKDERIRVIHQENGGGGKARNAALACATGRYIGFVDSDDYIAPDFFEYLLSLFDDTVDIAEADFMSVTEDTASFIQDETSVVVTEYTAQEALIEHIHDRVFRQIIWNKLYRRETVGAVRFPEGTKIDDEFWTYRVLGNASKLVRSNRVVYAYRQQSASVMHELSPTRRLEAIRAKQERCEYMSQAYPTLEPLCLVSLWMTCLYQRQLSMRSSQKEHKKAVKDSIDEVLRQHPICLKNIGDIDSTTRLWLTMAGVSLGFTCWLRNCLAIGM